MSRAGLFLSDLFGGSGVTSSVSGETSDLPRANLQTDLPGQMYQQWEGQEGGGSFEITTGTDDLVYINEGGGVITVQIPGGWFGTVAALLSHLNTETNDSANQTGGTLSHTYSWSYNAGSRTFGITAVGGVISIPNSSTPTRNLMTILLGWDATNLSGSTSYGANEASSSTQTWVQYVTPSGSGVIAPNLFALILESVGGSETSTAKMYGDVNIFASNSYLGDASAAWASGAALTVTVSDRPSETENTLQVGVTSNATGYRYWFVRWNHVDDHTHHRIGILRAMNAISSSTRTVREIQDQDLFVRTPARTLENQHPVALKSEWRMGIELERWEAADYRAWMVEAKRYGRDRGMVFALNWTTLLSGSALAITEADNGLLFYGTIREYSASSYAGNESDYISGQMSLGQLVP